VVHIVIVGVPIATSLPSSSPPAAATSQPKMVSSVSTNVVSETIVPGMHDVP